MSRHPSLRIAILAHSTNPRGGVVHALEVGDALARLGHHAVVHAPDAAGRGFFRETVCETMAVPAMPADHDTRRMVETRIADYLRHFARPGTTGFDVWHAQDGISANALATLKAAGRIPSFARTVHHVDHFQDQMLAALQDRAIDAADRLMVVSRLWRDWLAAEHGRDAAIVGNGVDLHRFSPRPDATDAILRDRLSLGGDPVFLAIGGVEERKNTIRILQAFARIRPHAPQTRLVIAGGASLLDHGAYQAAFAEALAASGLPEDAVTVTGPMPQSLMPALYRAATLLVFPSLREGFGLVVLEAMASGTLVATAQTEPFVSYLEPEDVFWCDPHDAGSIAAAMRAGAEPDARRIVRARGFARAAGHDWAQVAARHVDAYSTMLEAAHA
ncbi:MAG: MSMEG_0565 family glycosyltransferase [Proteobacteria bacterium]|nr:MSMEG_0565 family glycosyltransferase [Pseudomonadota bacterium]